MFENTKLSKERFFLKLIFSRMFSLPYQNNGQKYPEMRELKCMKKRIKKQNSDLKTRPVRAWTLAKRLEHRRVGSNKKKK